MVQEGWSVHRASLISISLREIWGSTRRLEKGWSIVLRYNWNVPNRNLINFGVYSPANQNGGDCGESGLSCTGLEQVGVRGFFVQ